VSDFPLERRQRFGARFVDCIKDFCSKHKLSVNRPSSPDELPAELEAIIQKLTPAIQSTYKLHVSMKLSATDLARQRVISESTVFAYLTTACQMGLPLHYDVLGVSEAKINLVLTALDKIGRNVGRLKPIMEALPPDSMDYNALKLAKSILIYEYGIEGSEVEEKEEDSPPTLLYNVSTNGPPPKKKKPIF
ncbi:unnamed protein product, partial [Auanema sp. JU1783]